MFLSYNGISFDLLRITDFQQTAVFTEDETNYLYNSIDIRCQCMLNTEVNGLGQVGVPQTYNTLVSKLKDIRKQLIVSSDGVEILRSPLTGMTTDFRFGPKCTVHRMDPFHGQSNIWMDLEFHTDLGCVDANYIISNRYNWGVSHDPETFAATHEIEGMAHFRVDKMLKDKVTPDEMRNQFIMPPPGVNFRRQPPNLIFHPGGDAVSYQIIDVETLLNGPGLPRFGATKIEIELSREYSAGLDLGKSEETGGMIRWAEDIMKWK